MYEYHEQEELQDRFSVPLSFYKADGVLTAIRVGNHKHLSIPYVARCHRWIAKNGGFSVTNNVYWIPYFSKEDRDARIEGFLEAAKGADVKFQDSTLNAFLKHGVFVYRGTK